MQTFSRFCRRHLRLKGTVTASLRQLVPRASRDRAPFEKQSMEIKKIKQARRHVGVIRAFLYQYARTRAGTRTGQQAPAKPRPICFASEFLSGDARVERGTPMGRASASKFAICRNRHYANDLNNGELRRQRASGGGSVRSIEDGQGPGAWARANCRRADARAKFMSAYPQRPDQGCCTAEDFSLVPRTVLAVASAESQPTPDSGRNRCSAEDFRVVPILCSQKEATTS
jgi:hypothetical protein